MTKKYKNFKNFLIGGGHEKGRGMTKLNTVLIKILIFLKWGEGVWQRNIKMTKKFLGGGMTKGGLWLSSTHYLFLKQI